MDIKTGGKTAKNELKIIVVGNSGTGKTSFVNKWTKNIFNENYNQLTIDNTDMFINSTQVNFSKSFNV